MMVIGDSGCVWEFLARETERIEMRGITDQARDGSALRTLMEGDDD